MVYADGRFTMALLHSKCFIYSVDGETWTQIMVSTSDEPANGLAYGNNKYISPLLGTGKVLTSADGFIWEEETSFDESRSLSMIKYINDKFVALERDLPNIFMSDDGIIWDIVPVSEDAHAWEDIDYAFGEYILIASLTDMQFRSKDGIQWEAHKMAVKVFPEELTDTEDPEPSPETSLNNKFWNRLGHDDNKIFLIAYGDKGYYTDIKPNYEICNSPYDHESMGSGFKSYYYEKKTGKILCNECVSAWIAKCSAAIMSTLVEEFNTMLPTEAILQEGDVFVKNLEVPIPNGVRGIFPYAIKIRTNYNNSGMYMMIYIGENLKAVMATVATITELEALDSTIESYLNTLISSTLTDIVIDQVIKIMDYKATLDTEITPDTGYSHCVVCDAPLREDYYLYFNKRSKAYCADHMYPIIINDANRKGFIEELGVSITPIPDPSIDPAVIRDWEHNTIVRYCDYYTNVLRKAHNITHVYVGDKIEEMNLENQM
jgi:hypothetical protein